MTITKSEARCAENFRMALIALCRVHQFDILAVNDGRDGEPHLQFEHLPPNKPHACLEAAELFSLYDQARADYLRRRVIYMAPPPHCEPRTPFKGPHGMESTDPVWQAAYDDGDEGKRPRSKDGVYVSGWCHGYASAHQCDDIEAEMAFYQFASPEGE